jgi:hypothetical protein
MGHFLDVQKEFSEMIREKGIQGALEWRDGPFGGIVGRYPPPRKSRKR